MPKFFLQAVALCYQNNLPTACRLDATGNVSKNIDSECCIPQQFTIVVNFGCDSIQNNGTRLCFFDNDGTDCNAQLDIGAILGKVIRTSADLSFATGGNITWHTRLATGYKYQDTPCE